MRDRLVARGGAGVPRRRAAGPHDEHVVGGVAGAAGCIATASRAPAPAPPAADEVAVEVLDVAVDGR